MAKSSYEKVRNALETLIEIARDYEDEFDYVRSAYGDFEFEAQDCGNQRALQALDCSNSMMKANLELLDKVRSTAEQAQRILNSFPDTGPEYVSGEYGDEVADAIFRIAGNEIRIVRFEQSDIWRFEGGLPGGGGTEYEMCISAAIIGHPNGCGCQWFLEVFEEHGNDENQIIQWGFDTWNEALSCAMQALTMLDDRGRIKPDWFE